DFTLYEPYELKLYERLRTKSVK
ncbi:hypothetical protein RRG08_054055, partial [Elysia crispata]